MDQRSSPSRNYSGRAIFSGKNLWSLEHSILPICILVFLFRVFCTDLGAYFSKKYIMCAGKRFVWQPCWERATSWSAVGRISISRQSWVRQTGHVASITSKSACMKGTLSLISLDFVYAKLKALLLKGSNNTMSLILPGWSLTARCWFWIGGWARFVKSWRALEGDWCL